MNFDENITEVFDRYLMGGMNEAEEKEFLQQLDTDPAFKEAYEWHRTIVAGIREARREELKDYIKQKANIRYIGNVWSRSWVATSAAVVAVFFVSYIAIKYFINAPSESPMVDKTTQVDSTQITAQKEEGKQGTTENDEHETSEQRNNNATRPDDINKGVDKDQSTVPALENQKFEDNQYAEDVTPEIKRQIDVYAVSKRTKERQSSPTVSTPTVSKIEASNNLLWVHYKPAEAYKYQYSQNKLTLYKVQYEDQIALYEVEMASYLGWNKNYYPLKKDGKMYPLERLSDTTLLKALPPLK